MYQIPITSRRRLALKWIEQHLRELHRNYPLEFGSSGLAALIEVTELNKRLDAEEVINPHIFEREREIDDATQEKLG